MDPSSYKDITVSRGFQYHYYFSAPKDSHKPFLLFLHGFPSTSYDWRHQIAFFGKEGYGLIAPDMLGYGGTSKPADTAEYKATLISKDVIEILDAEKVEKVVAIGHDWGSKFTGRLANYYLDRFLGFAFLTVPYLPPGPAIKYEDLLAMCKKLTGSELYGYWGFFSSEEAEKLISDHWDSFVSLLYADDGKLWVDYLAPTGGIKSWLESDKKTKIGSFLTEEELKTQTEAIRKGGLTGPLAYYKVFITNIDAEDDESVPKEKVKIVKPVFFGASLRDFVSLAGPSKVRIAQVTENSTIHEYDAGHWLPLERPAEVNKDLLEWIKGL